MAGSSLGTLDVLEGEVPSVDLSNTSARRAIPISTSLAGHLNSEYSAGGSRIPPTSLPDVVAAVEKSTAVTEKLHAATLKVHTNIRAVMSNQRSTRGALV